MGASYSRGKWSFSPLGPSCGHMRRRPRLLLRPAAGDSSPVPGPPKYRVAGVVWSAGDGPRKRARRGALASSTAERFGPAALPPSLAHSNVYPRGFERLHSARRVRRSRPRTRRCSLNPPSLLLLAAKGRTSPKAVVIAHDLFVRSQGPQSDDVQGAGPRDSTCGQQSGRIACIFSR